MSPCFRPRGSSIPKRQWPQTLLLLWTLVQAPHTPLRKVGKVASQVKRAFYAYRSGLGWPWCPL